MQSLSLVGSKPKNRARHCMRSDLQKKPSLPPCHPLQVYYWEGGRELNSLWIYGSKAKEKGSVRVWWEWEPQERGSGLPSPRLEKTQARDLLRGCYSLELKCPTKAGISPSLALLGVQGPLRGIARREVLGY